MKVTLLNFQVTEEGLSDQINNIIVRIEEPEKDRQVQKNIIEMQQIKEKQKSNENLILQLLQETKDILGDDNLITTLQMSKADQATMEDKQQRLNKEKSAFEAVKKFYSEVAIRAANLYFVILDLSLIEPTY